MSFGQEPKSKPAFPPLPDPRIPIYRTFSEGIEAPLLLSDCFIVIAWDKSLESMTGKAGYQLWGDERILSKDELSASLRVLYEKTEGRADRPHLIVVGNQWGAGRELDPVMKLLSKGFGIDIFYHGGTYAFREVAFAAEKRQAAIRAAIAEGVKRSEQGGADQPATAPESKSKGGSKPKPESKVRPQQRVEGLGRSPQITTL